VFGELVVVGRVAPTDIALDRIQSCDPFQSFSSQGEAWPVEVIELAANVRPTRTSCIDHLYKS